MAEEPARPVTQTRISDGIGIVTFSKPPVNPLSADVCAALLEAFDELEGAQVRVVIVAADPTTTIWSAGHDIHEIPLDGHDAVTWTTGFERVLRRVRTCPAPVIAMLHSSVSGAACDLAVTCDLATGTPRTTFAITPVKLGISYNTGGMSHFLGALPLHVIKEMAFTGDPLSADDAYRFGLLNRLVESERLEEVTMELARTIAGRAPLAVNVIKTELRSLTAGVALSADEFEEIQSVRRAAFMSDDLKEGVAAFFEKRAPVFRGSVTVMPMGDFPVLTAEEAAELIPHGATLGIGGFTDPGVPQAVTRALALRARALHDAGEPFQVRVLAGAEAGPAGDIDLAEADAVSFRMPFQSEGASRAAINDGRIEFHDEHLSHCSQQLLEGFFGSVDIAIIEASDITDDGRVYFTTAIGNGPTFLRMADKVIIEVNRRHPQRVCEFADILLLPLPPHRDPLPIRHPLDRIGLPYAPVDPAKVIGVVETDAPSTRPAPRPPDPASRQIAEHLVHFFQDEISAGRLPAEFLPLQSGVGNVGNALIADLAEHPDLPPFTMFTEVFQDSCVDAMRAGRLTGASACALTLSEDRLQEVYDDLAFFEPRIVLRPQELSNHPTVIRQLGVIATNTAMEIDIYGHVNSSHVCGTQLLNGLGGAGDFERNARLSVFVCHSTAKGGRVSSIVPFCTHVDHSEHSVHVIVTEQGLADLRGLGPAARAQRIIDKCAHPAYRDYLHKYVEGARQGHIRHDLARCFELHRNFMEYGAMLPGLDLSQFGGVPG